MLEATTVGNVAEVQSELIAGKADELERTLQKLEVDYKELSEQLEKTKQVLTLLQVPKDPKQEPRQNQERRMQVTRFKISLDSQMNENLQKRQRLLEKLELYRFSHKKSSLCTKIGRANFIFPDRFP